MWGRGGWGELEANDITAGQRKRGERQSLRRVGHLALGARARPAPAGTPVLPETMQRSPLEKASVFSQLFFR